MRKLQARSPRRRETRPRPGRVNAGPPERARTHTLQSVLLAFAPKLKLALNRELEAARTSHSPPARLSGPAADATETCGDQEARRAGRAEMGSPDAPAPAPGFPTRAPRPQDEKKKDRRAAQRTRHARVWRGRPLRSLSARSPAPPFPPGSRARLQTLSFNACTMRSADARVRAPLRHRRSARHPPEKGRSPPRSEPPAQRFRHPARDETLPEGGARSLRRHRRSPERRHAQTPDGREGLERDAAALRP